MKKSTTILKRIEVKWKDHFSEAGWKETAELKEWVAEHKDLFCTTRGFLVYEDRHVLVVAGTFDGEEMFGDFQAIYKNHILTRSDRRG